MDAAVLREAGKAACQGFSVDSAMVSSVVEVLCLMSGGYACVLIVVDESINYGDPMLAGTVGL